MKDQGNKDYWEKTAKVYGRFMQANDKTYQEVSHKIMANLNRHMTVLELACGTGQLSFRLAPKVKLWEATDFSPNMIAQAKKQSASSRLKFSVQDATQLPYSDSSFDVVVMANALHVMPHPELALAEIHRVLKPGGIFFAPTFVEGQGLLQKVRIKFIKITGFKIFHHWTGEQLKGFLEQNHFIVTEYGMIPGGGLPICYLQAVPQKNYSPQN